MWVGAAWLWAAALVSEGGGGFRWTGMAIFTLVYLALFGTVVAFGLYFWLLRHTPANRLSVIAYVTPAVALVLGVLVRDEPIGRDPAGSRPSWRASTSCTAAERDPAPGARHELAGAVGDAHTDGRPVTSTYLQVQTKRSPSSLKCTSPWFARRKRLPRGAAHERRRRVAPVCRRGESHRHRGDLLLDTSTTSSSARRGGRVVPPRCCRSCTGGLPALSCRADDGRRAQREVSPKSDAPMVGVDRGRAAVTRS